MLDRMRRHRNWLKWSLALVCLAFVIFYIPDLVGVGPTVVSADNVAVIDGQAIRADEFRRTYQAQLQAYRSAYGGNMSDQLLKQLGIDQQILAQMVDERAALVEARRVGMSVSDEEVAQRIFSIPAFQENGTFIGSQRYQQLLASQRPPLTTTDFEDGVRRMLAEQEDCYYYVTVMNENYAHPSMPADAVDGILRGMYKLPPTKEKKKPAKH
jgi:hypothetical protein